MILAHTVKNAASPFNLPKLYKWKSLTKQVPIVLKKDLLDCASAIRIRLANSKSEYDFMLKIVLATRNQHKIQEIRHILKDMPFELLSLGAFENVPEVVEDGETFFDNAFKKAKTVYDATGLPALADDSGLEVDFLNGDPGVYSSRFAGENATDEQNNEKLLNLLNHIPKDKRSAKFRCVAVYYNASVHQKAEGICRGEILTGCYGEGGFGYDPMFYVPQLNQTLAQISEEAKNSISHRGQAFRKMAELLNNLQ